MSRSLSQLCLHVTLCSYRMTRNVGNNPELVIESIRGGQRPPTPKKIDKEGWNELVNLMEQCWDNDPSKRPKFKGKCPSLSPYNILSEQYA